ncbi:MAG: hypothetical protein ACM3JB_10120 [Acidobacteriaceae bacterium]
MAQYIKVAVIGANFDEFVIPPVPLIQHLFHQILVCVQPEANRPFVGFPPGIAFHL